MSNNDNGSSSDFLASAMAGGSSFLDQVRPTSQTPSADDLSISLEGLDFSQISKRNDLYD